MSRPLLFCNTSSSNISKYLVEFKAGKMIMKGTTVIPVKRKGLVFLNQSDDNLMHFCWKDRKTGQTEDDLILFPDDAEFKKVNQCTTGRVYVLKFKSSARRCFYWMQEPNEDKDEELCKKINEYLNNPPIPGSRSVSSTSSNAGHSGLGTDPNSLGGMAELGSLGESDLHNLINNMNSQQLMQVLGMQNASSLLNMDVGSLGARNRSSGLSNQSSTRNEAETAPGTSGFGSSQAPAATTIKLSDLQSIISGLTVPSEEQKDNDVKVYLPSVINSEALQALLMNEQFMNGVRERLPSTDCLENSDNEKSTVAEHLSATVQSPQFQQAINKFSMALQSGQLGPLLQQFGLSQACIDAANNGDLEQFFKVLEEEEKSKKNKDKKDKDDSEMALD